MNEQQMEWQEVLEMRGLFGDVLIEQGNTYRGPLRELREDDGHIVIVLGGRARRTLVGHTWEPCDHTYYECRIPKTVKPTRISANRVFVFTPEIGTINLCPKDDTNTFKPDELIRLGLTPSSP